jgi:hypothetical protein
LEGAVGGVTSPVDEMRMNEPVDGTPFVSTRKSR